MAKNIAVIFAGGVGVRMHHNDLPKQFIEINGKPIIIHTLDHFDLHPEIDAIVIACVKEWMDYLQELIQKHHINKVRKIVPGGSCSQLSIYEGLLAAEEIAEEGSIVLIHDGVRPLINAKLISDNLVSVKAHGSAITSSKATETFLLVDENSNEIVSIPSRNRSSVAKAPQSFYLADILKAHRRALSEEKTDFIDCCSMMQYYHYPLYLVDGPHENIKITTIDDLYMMKAFLDVRKEKGLNGEQ